MSKEEIYDKVCRWIDSGKLVQRSNITKDGNWYSVWKSVERGTLFLTSNDRIVATDANVRDEFQRLLKESRVMTLAGVTIRHPEYATMYSINKLVKQGELLKIDKLSSVTLYVE